MTLSKTKIMGIVNLTPDSFSNDGLFPSKDLINNALIKIESFLNEGADWIDIGAESTRPGSKPISLEEEQKRLFPTLIEIIKNFPNIQISIDTTKPEIAKQALEAGVCMVNDQSGGGEEMFKHIKQFGVPIVLMHAKPHFPITDQSILLSKENANIFLKKMKTEIIVMTQKSIDFGVKKENIIIDPGIGFGKTVAENVAILALCKEFLKLEFPVLIGASKKSFIDYVLQKKNKDPYERVSATFASSIWCFEKNIDYIRVHDVKETKDAFSMWNALKEQAEMV